MGFFKHEKASVHPEAKIGDGTRIWANTNIQAGAVIGKGCNICDGSFVEKGAIVGNAVTVKHHVSIFDGVTIEDNVFIGSNIAFINDRYPRSARHDAWTLEKTLIKKGATIGSNAVVMCGLTVGEYAMIGAGAVVIRDVPPFAIMVGSPAKCVGYACVCGRKLDKKYQCAQCRRQLKMKNKKLTLDE